MKSKKLAQGQSLIEVVTALGVIVLVLTALAVVVTLSIANAKFSQNQTLASKYSQEVMEKLRAYRDQNTWDVFTSNCNGGSSLTLSDLPSTGSWTRGIVCTVNGDTCGVVVTVGWADAKGRIHKSELKTNFTSWRE